VAEASNSRIQKFDSDGGFLTKWGTNGGGNGQFSEPRAVAVDGDGNIYVADSLNHRIQKFDSDGGFLTTWGAFGTGDGTVNLIEEGRFSPRSSLASAVS
jgi:DNA-binding beta-propeller fold protein YncE